MLIALAIAAAMPAMPDQCASPACDNVVMPAADPHPKDIVQYERSPESLDWFDRETFPWFQCALINVFAGNGSALKSNEEHDRIALKAIDDCGIAKTRYAEDWSYRADANEILLRERLAFVRMQLATVIIELMRSH